MIIRRDGKSNIYKDDCFNKKITEELKEKNINIGLINPPYSQKDVTELEFVEHLLEVLTVGGTGVAVVPRLSARHCVTFEDEWLCEAYMQTDYSKLSQEDFQQTVNNYLAYLVESGDVHES